MENILYVGGFELPDLNAAAQRVLGIAKGMRELGSNVFFLNYSSKAERREWVSYYDFQCYQVPKPNLSYRLTCIDDVKQIAIEKKISAIVSYNYPAIALQKLILWCRKMHVRCFADATEWYIAQGNIAFRMVKKFDTEWRMRILHKKMDGVIAISDYLYRFYWGSINTVKIPPTVDTSDEKWKVAKKEQASSNLTTFIYAGSPSAQKERLDLIVDAIEQVACTEFVQLRVVGITQEQYERMYDKTYIGTHVVFLGRIEHLQVVAEVIQSDWSIIIRDNNKVVKAGFPTKVVESISCGTPVIVNRFSNIEDYLDEKNCIFCEQGMITEALKQACTKRTEIDSTLFDFHNYTKELKTLLYTFDKN